MMSTDYHSVLLCQVNNNDIHVYETIEKQVSKATDKYEIELVVLPGS